MAGSMDTSSGSVSSPWIHGAERRYSPIPYRTGPLEYEPAVHCHCGRKAAFWISWSDENPGRRYLKCYRARENGCDFMVWYEGLVDPFVQTLLLDLRNAVWRLRKQNAALNGAIAYAAVKAQDEKKEVCDRKMEAAEARGEIKRIGTEKKMLRAMVVVLLAVVFYLWRAQ